MGQIMGWVDAVKRLIPKKFVKSVYDIDFNELQHRGFKAIILDLDNTLIETDKMDVTPELMHWLKQLESMGFRVMIVSNNTKTRVATFANMLQVPYIHAAKKPFYSSFQKALHHLEATPEETVIVGDQLLTDVLGGNKAGLYTILVVPISEREGFWTKVNRTFEKLVFVWMDLRGIKRWEE